MSTDRNGLNRGLFGATLPKQSPTDNFLNDLMRSLEATRAHSPPTVLDLAKLLAPAPPTPQPNVLGSLFGLQSSELAKPFSSTPQVRRKVFFSFHFEEDVRRSCLVRNSYRIRPGRKLPTANFHDRSLWESSKREGEESLKRLIREGMVGSSVTCVLTGSYTWQRRWVRYEIARSLVCGNGLFTVYIHNVKDPRYGISIPGYNPLDFMGLELRPDGRGNICERVGEQWQLFDMHRAPVPWPRWLEKPAGGYIRILSHGARAYDYHFDDGYTGLAEWAQLAAWEAGRP